jgi:ssDNA thymidine ADP-ribosyltransferase, DarT
MSKPLQPKIYHITHGKNLAGILKDGCLWSDAEIRNRGGPATTVGIADIKDRRLTELFVPCHQGTKVGEFVPFYFCPRSVMLYILHRCNHSGLDYSSGQRPILHLVAELNEVVAWADLHGRQWAFTDRNAGTRYFQTFSNLEQLDELNWDHIAAGDFRESVVQEAKQAEFLLYGSFPLSLVRSIGVMDEAIADRVRQILIGARLELDVRVERDWYY